MSDGNIRLPRRILYVDASFCNQTQESKICLYDVDENRLDILKTKLPTSSSFSERYAIVYGCLYAKKLNILLNALNHLQIENRPYISLGQMGKFLKHNNPTFTYSSLKKILEKYPKDFRIVNSNYVKRIN